MPDTDATNHDDALRRALRALQDMRSRVERAEQGANEPIAVIGLGCRFPGASSPAEFWDMLTSGTDAVGPVPRSRWNHDEYYDPDPDTPGKMTNDAGGFVEWPVDEFDAAFFGIAPVEARDLDPQHRLLLEVTWETFEHAGIDPAAMSGSRTGVWVGISCTDYANLQGIAGKDAVGPYYGTGVAQAVAAGRIAYNFGLRGPTMAVDTACSSSLVATMQAVDALRAGTCDAALAGGVHLMLQPESMLVLSKLRALSPTGRCRTFSADADGYARSEGCGMILLKRLSDARRDGDRILSVIRGGAINHDGRSSGLTVPSGSAQRELLATALERAGVSADGVQVLEAHGTGTPLGDPIELRAVDHVYGQARDADNPLVIGSVKTNIGHLEAAAGVAGVIKLVLSLHNEHLPPHLHATNLTPHVEWDQMPIEVNREPRAWHRSETPRRGAVSAFGLSGTNAHLVFEEAPAPDSGHVDDPPAGPSILALSSHTSAALDRLAVDYTTLLDTTSASVTDLAFSSTRRGLFDHRAAVVGSTSDELRRRLADWREHGDGSGAVSGLAADRRSIGFLFTGQGSQYVGMAVGLYDTEPVFRASFDECAALLDPHLPAAVGDVLRGSVDGATLDDTTFAQPAIFAVQHALVMLWRSWGVEPVAVAGHSIGEYAAAVAAGILDLESASRLLTARSTLMGALPSGGKMAAVFADASTVEAHVAGLTDVSIAAYNGATSVVISGTDAVVERITDQLRSDGVDSMPLLVSHAFHSPLMAPMIDDFRAVADTIAFAEPTIDFVSCGDGGRPVTDPEYWVEHVRKPVRFSGAVDRMLQLGIDDLVEIGPQPILTAMVRRDHGDALAVHPSLRTQGDDQVQTRSTLAALWSRGHGIDLDAVNGHGALVDLPTYPYERERFWGPIEADDADSGPRLHPLLHERISSPAIVGDAYQGRLGARQPPYLADHQVFGTTVVPASGQIEMVLAAACDALGRVPMSIVGVSFRDMLVLPDGPRRRVQVVLDPPTDGRIPFSLYSESSTGWQLHTDGSIELAAPETTAPPAFEFVGDDVDLAGQYEDVAELGVDYGPTFRVLDRMAVGDGQVVAALELRGDSQRTGAGAYVAHPALFDGCFQMSRALFPDLEGGDDMVYLPVGFDRLDVHAPFGASCHARFVESPGTASSALIHADIDIVCDGEVLARVDGLKLAKVRRSDVRAQAARAIASAGGSSGERWIHAVDWVPAPAEPTPPEPGPWLVVGSATARSLRTALKAAGHRVVVVADATDIEDVPIPANGWAGIVDTMPADAPGASRDVAIRPVLDTAQALIHVASTRHLLAAGGRFWVVTRSGIAVGDDRDIDPVQAMASGFVNTLSTEEPSLRPAHLDLDDATDSLSVAAASLMGAEDRVAIRSGRAYVARLDTIAPTEAQPIDWAGHTGTVLITGGLGGLGLEAARAVVELGATQVALVSRRAPDEATLRLIDSIRELGAEVEIYAADVADGVAATELVARVDSEQAPVRAVIHAAGVLDDGLVRNLTWDRFEAVVAPKLDGAEHLDAATADRALDAFVLYGSAASVIGSSGQANYAAANAALDAIASRRRRRGLSAVSIAWGPWAEVGMASRTEVDAAPGTRRIDPATGRTLLGRVLTTDAERVAILPFDWRILSSSGAAELRRPFFERLYEAPEDGQADAAFRAQLAALDVDERIHAVRDQIITIVAGVLGLGADVIGADVAFTDLGLDSLMAVETANRLQRRMGVIPAATAAFEFPTAQLLAVHVLDDLLDLTSAEPATPTPAVPPAPPSKTPETVGPEPVEPGEVPALGPIERPERIAASAAQNRLLFIDQFEPGLAVYNLTTATRIEGDIRIDAIQVALDSIVERHEALRTNFERIEGVYHQVVADARPVELIVEDWRDRPDATEAEITEHILDRCQQPFDLANDQKLRALLIRTGDDSCYFASVMHHIASDGWSLTRMVAEFAELYQATLQGREAALEELPIQYIDYADWLQRTIDAGAIDGQLEYWRDQLSGELPVLSFPADLARPPVRTYAGGTHHFRVDPDIVAAARRYSASNGATLFMTLYASYVAALARYTGQDEIIVGTANANRGQPEVAPLVAFLANTLALRTHVDLDADFRTLVELSKRTLLDATVNQDAPFDRVVAEVSPPRDLSRPPIFQTMFILMNMPIPTVELDGVTLERVDLDHRWIDYELGVDLIEIEGELLGKFRYNTALFDETSIAQFTEHWLNLLNAAVDGTSTPVGMLPLVESGDDPTAAWNETAVDIDLDRRVHDLVSEQAARVPDKVAVVAGDERITYRDLETRSNQLANHLRSIGVAEETFVGVVADRSLEMVVALLGVLKAGAAYLPLDPAYPADRLELMLDDSGATTVVDPDGQLGSAMDLSRATVVDPVRDRDAIAAQADDAPEVSGDLAYIIYTSGSTGRPKGVVLQHSNVVNFLHTMGEQPGLVEDDVLLAVTTLSFDISVLELFLPLVTGASVVMASPAAVADGTRLAGLIDASGATIMQATPVTWNLLFDSGWTGSAGLRVLSGGETMSRALADRLLEGCAEVWNMFGPTETTVWSTIHRVEPGPEAVPIGRPIANTVVDIVEPSGASAPIGVPGELLIGGAGVARGYHQRFELTAERFIPDPRRPGERLYRTGDLARWRRDGTIEFFGRLDHQVKVRGHRIELGEIEARLRSSPAVADAVVAAHGAANDARLVAYLIASDPTDEPTAADLRAHLQTSVPDYMVPALFVFLAEFPVTPNNKIDRRALPHPDDLQRAETAVYVAPESAAESVIADLFGATLQYEPAGALDNFFERGGHSLQATTLLVQVAGVFGPEIGLREFFEDPTPRGVLRVIEQLDGDPGRVEQIASIEQQVQSMSSDEVDAVLGGPEGSGP